MADQLEEIVPYERSDYMDMLEPGYRFCPTDSEIIVYYLKQKIETGQHPECRLYEVNINEHNPDELAERYRPCENKWYFLTPRERKYRNGDRPNRITRDFGRWKITQKYRMVYDDVSGLPVGNKSSLVYEVEKNRKTPWLMHEYTTIDPNLPIGSGQDGKKLTDWVLCKIYKKETNQSSNNNRAARVQYMRNQEEENGEQNRFLDEPSPIRRRLSVNQASNELNEPVHVQIQETNHHLGSSFHMVAPVTSIFNVNQQPVNSIDTEGLLNVSMGFSQTLSVHQTRINTITQQVDTFQDLFSTQPPLIDPTGVSTSTSVAASAQPSDYDTLVISPPLVISRHMPLDVAGRMNQPNDYTSIRSFPDQDNSFDSVDGISLDDLNIPIVPSLPTESGQDGKKLSDLVLCKIYKETNQKFNNNGAENFQDTGNQEEVNEEQNVGNNQPNEHQYVEYQEANLYSNQQSVNNIIMNSSPTNTMQQMDTFHISNSIQSPVEESHQVFTGEEVQSSFGNSTSVYYQNPYISTEPSAFDEPRQGEEVQPSFQNSTTVYYQNPSISTTTASGASISYPTEPPAVAFDYRSPTSMTTSEGLSFDEYARRFITNVLDSRSHGGYTMFW